MTTPSRTQLARLRAAGKTLTALQAAAAAHHAAIEAACKAGCTDSQLAIELDVSRQAIAQYRKRWLTPGRAKRLSDPGQPMLLG